MGVEPPRPRHIVILCDGTGKNGQHDSVNGVPTTNIWRLYQAIKPQEGDIVKYFPGVGADNAKVTAMDLLARTFGHTAVASIREIYMTIAQNYKDGDSISLFGYSRGAFIVRKVASLIGALGLITDEAEFNKYWKGMEHKLPGKRRSTPRPPNPRVVPISLPDVVQSALHVVAYHENRKLFNVVLFDGNNSEKQLCKQTLFPGCHSDVGGGGDKPKAGKNILPDVTLHWMLKNMPQTIQVALGEELVSEVPKWYPLNSAFHDGPAWKRIPDKLYRRVYLPDMDGLLRHRSLSGLPSPDSPHLLTHDWELVEHPDEEENVKPVAKRSLIRRFTEKVKSATTSTVRERPALPLLPVAPPLPSQISWSTEPQALPHRRPTNLQHDFRPDSATTDQTDATTDTQDTISTPRTSLRSVDFAPEAQACKDDVPDMDISEPSTPKPVPVPQLPIPESVRPAIEQVEKIEPIADKIDPATIEPETEQIVPKVEQIESKTEKAEPIMSEKVEPISEKVAPTKPAVQTRPAVQAQPRPQKKGIMQKIKAMLCCGSSDQMEG
ncbi:hypothetical protein FRC10_011345 [Ceratobasidium sp. 414]|nr:hypothetical protein FRC10_011345 [Ceratobasidium sp. 414]